MTTKRTYTCNLCGDATQEGAGVGVIFSSHRPHKIKFTVPMNAENHLCQNCLTAIDEAHRETARIAKARAECA